MYRVQITLTIPCDGAQEFLGVKCRGWVKTVQIPTFELDEDLHGISSEEEALLLALRIVNPDGNSRITFHGSAVKM